MSIIIEKYLCNGCWMLYCSKLLLLRGGALGIIAFIVFRFLLLRRITLEWKMEWKIIL